MHGGINMSEIQIIHINQNAQLRKWRQDCCDEAWGKVKRYASVPESDDDDDIFASITTYVRRTG